MSSYHPIMIPVQQCNCAFVHHIIVATATSSSKSDPHAYLEIACLLIVVMALHTTTTAYQMPYQIPHVAEPVAIVLDDQAPLSAEGDQCICGVPPNASIHVKAVSLSTSRRITNSNNNALLSTKLFFVIGTVLRRAITNDFTFGCFRYMYMSCRLFPHCSSVKLMGVDQ